MFTEMKLEIHNMSENKSKREETLEAILMLNFSKNSLSGWVFGDVGVYRMGGVLSVDEKREK